MKNFKPILFSTAMVQAILNLLKTQTRRIIKVPTEFTFKNLYTTRRVWDSTKEENPNPIKTVAVFLDALGEEFPVKSKYQVGDILWVRETWCPTGSEEYLHKETGRPYFYKADVKDLKAIKEIMQEFGYKWKPSIFMPKAACRIFLEVTNLRVERLQDIIGTDAVAEGIEVIENEKYGRVFKHYFMGDQEHYFKVPELSFKTLWQSINGHDSWDANPWVWVYDFKRIENPENFLS